CSSESQCWAVGTVYVNNNGYFALIEKWDGNSWTIINAPSTGTLKSVTCTSASECWAVGNTDGQIHTLIMRWNGSFWSVVTSPNPNSFDDYLNVVACTSASNCWAAGNYFGSGPLANNKTLIAHWDGSSWSVTASPNPSSASGFLNAVTCPSSSQCWAVGT